MSEALYPYYERELIFIRQLAQDFARQYPASAGRLMLEPNRSIDPHVERMIEAFALLSARIHHKLDDEFPELTSALLDVLYPHYLAPVPSMAIVQFQLDAARGELPDGFTIAKGSRLHTSRVGNLACKFRTGYPTTLWPIELKFARLQAAPFPAGYQPPPRTAAALRLQFECVSQMKLSDLSLDKLRFYLDGEAQVVAHLYELLFNHALRVDFRPIDGPRDAAPLSLTPAKTLFQVGFEADEGLLPYPSRSFIGYRLLSEFFAFPSKFLFLDLAGWKEARQAGVMNKQVEVVIYFGRSGKVVEQGVDASTFALGCAPVINLFEQIAEPINVSQTRHEYRIVPDVAHPLGMEVYSVDSVMTADPTAGASQELVPFYAFRHGRSPETQEAFWYASRRLSRLEGDRGMDTYLTLVDHAFTPYAPADSTLVVHTTCTNRGLPNQLQMVGDSVRFELEAAAPLTRIRCVRSPTAPQRPPLRRGAHWGLVSHLNLNHLSISDAVEGREALQQILRLYDFSDPAAGQQQMSDVTRQLIEGITAVSSSRVVGRSGSGSNNGFCRGVQIRVEFDEQMYIGTGVFLFACVLERFLALYASINSFSQLVAATRQREGIVKKWPPRTGELQLL